MVFSRQNGALFASTLILTSFAGAASAQNASTPAPSTAPAAEPIAAKPAAKAVETVIVTARPNSQQTKIDRTTYDIRTRPEAPVSPAVDVIAKLPGVFVGPNNRVSVAGGAYVTILVDGRPMLRDAALQIPAERIASIEVITNPSAEFASTSEAVINIILKKAHTKGRASGSISASIDTLNNRSLNMSHDRGGDKWGLSVSVRLAERGADFLSSSSLRFLNPSPGGLEEVTGTGGVRTNSQQVSGFLRLTRDLSEINKIEFTSSMFKLEGDYAGTGESARRTGNQLVFEKGFYNGQFSPSDVRTGLTFISEKEKDYKFETSLDWSRNGFLQSNTNNRPALVQETTRDSSEETMSFDSKYEKHFSEDRILTAGGSLSNSNFSLAYDDRGYISATGRQTDLFEAQGQNVALYATYQFKIGKIGILPGLRFESTQTDWTSRGSQSNGRNAYERVLPSLYLTRALSENSKLKLSYSEGTSGSSFDQLNPFFRYNSEFSATRGNPSLEPGDRRTIELGYEFNKDGTSLVSTLFHRSTTNSIVRFSNRGANNLLVSNSANLGEVIAYGLGATLKGKVGAKFNYTVDFEVSSNSLSNPFLNFDGAVKNELAYNGKFIVEYKPNSVDQISLTTTFQSDRTSVGSVYEGFWTTNLQFSHKFPKKLTLTINAVDVGVSPVRLSREFGPGFESTGSSQESTRALRIGLTQRF